MNHSCEPFSRLMSLILLSFLIFESGCFQGVSPANGDNDVRRGKKRNLASQDDDASKNPYAGAGKASEPAEISGAWLAQCDIVEIGAALGKDEDKIMCRVQDPTGRKYAESVDFEFFDSDDIEINSLAKRDLPSSNYFNIEYDLPTKKAKNYAWVDPTLNPDAKKLRLDYEIMKLTSAMLGGATKTKSGYGLADLISDPKFAGVKPDETVCSSEGDVLPTFRPAPVICGLSEVLETLLQTGKNRYCAMKDEDLHDKSTIENIDLNNKNGCFLPVTQILFGSQKHLYLGTTGCAIAYYAPNGKDREASFLVFRKKDLKDKVKKSKDLTYEKLLSHIHGRICR